MPHAAMLHAVQQSRLFRHQVWPCTFLTPLRNFGLRSGHGHKERHESSRRSIVARSLLYLYYNLSISISHLNLYFHLDLYLYCITPLALTVYMPTCSHVDKRACLHAYRLACVHDYMHLRTCLHAYMSLLAYMLTCLHDYMITGILA